MPKGKQGGKREKVYLTRDMGDYTPFSIQETWLEKEARKEYSRLRNVVVKRLKRIQEVEPEAKVLERWKPEYFKELKNIKNFRELSHLLSDVAYLVNASSASLSGRKETRKKQIEKLKELGVDIKNVQELKDFGEFMEKIRVFSADRIYDSERAASIYEDYHDKKDNKEMLDMYSKYVSGRRTRPRR